MLCGGCFPRVFLLGFFLLYVFFVGRCGKGHERCVGRGVHSFPVVYIFLFSCGIETNLGWGGGGLPWSGGVNKWLALESRRTWAGVGNVDISAETIFLEWRFRWCTLSFLWGRYEKGVCACVRVWYCSFLWGFLFWYWGSSAHRAPPLSVLRGSHPFTLSSICPSSTATQAASAPPPPSRPRERAGKPPPSPARGPSWRLCRRASWRGFRDAVLHHVLPGFSFGLSEIDSLCPW